MGQGMSEVLPNVYVTSAFVARQGKVLEEFGITHVISIMNTPITPFPHRKYLLISAKDHISQDLLQFATRCNDFIHEARINNGKVMIHCVEGKSRSASIACIYIMTITGTFWCDTINSIRGIRTFVEPNFSFQRQLKHFYENMMNQERERLFAKYGAYEKSDPDRTFVTKNLALYNEEQLRRTSSKTKTADRSHLTRGDFTGIELIDSVQKQKIETVEKPHINNDNDQESAPLTPESQRIFEEMFSSGN